MYPNTSKRFITLALTMGFTATVHAAEPLTTIEVTATRIAYPESDATYAAEVHTKAMIERSGARTLTDYLAQQSSLTVMPSFGNRFTPTLEMRGYGLESGAQNIAISIDGQRLNEIDLQPQLLGAIALSSIERIEIIKGSGSVMNGDGAMAGAVNIITKPQTGGTVDVRVGDHNAQVGSVNWGYAGEMFRFSVGADNDRHDGFAHQDPSGKPDETALRSERVSLGFKPTQALDLTFDAAQARTDVRYQNALTPAQFDDDASQNGGLNYTHDITTVKRWHAGASYAINDALTAHIDHRRLDKIYETEAWWGGYQYNYDHEANEASLVYNTDTVDLTAGVQQADASRERPQGFPADRMEKNNEGVFAQANWRIGATTLSLGGRQEQVEYHYKTATTHLSDEHDLSAWDVGVNQKLNDQWAIFANINGAFQAPDVDRFFTMAGAFNGLIEPAKAKTLNIGTHYSGNTLRSKLVLFRANVTNEIYYNPVTYANTNIDESHKYGLEMEHRWQANDALSLTGRYVWTRATIDSEDSGNGAFDGKDMPGVPEHGINVTASYALTDRVQLTATHAWRDSSYAISDFDNNSDARQKRYESTSVHVRYHGEQVDYYASVDNLFAKKNGLWISDDSNPWAGNVIYPVNYERSFVLGARVKF
jgi:iron complex outermembrane recepter protein